MLGPGGTALADTIEPVVPGTRDVAEAFEDCRGVVVAGVGAVVVVAAGVGAVVVVSGTAVVVDAVTVVVLVVAGTVVIVVVVVATGAIPAMSIRRITLPLSSDTNTCPKASAVIPIGLLNPAELPLPSSVVPPAPPASVVTTPAGVIIRMVLPLRSATYMFPVPSVVIDVGV